MDWGWKKNEFTIIVNKDKDPELIDYLGRVSQMFNIPFELKKCTTSNKVVYFAF